MKHPRVVVLGIVSCVVFLGIAWRVKVPTERCSHNDEAAQLTSSASNTYLEDFPETDSIPFRGYIKSREELRRVEWMSQLYDYLQTLSRTESPHLSIVFGDYDHRMIVLNWIVAATVKLEFPLENVVVLSLDRKLCDFLTSCNYTGWLRATCITASTQSVLALSSRRGHEWVTAMMIRQIAIRLINYWGYDIASYDSDAVLLRNPKELYDMHPYAHLLSSASTWPHDLGQRWGFTLCAGAILFKASHNVEAFWGYMSNSSHFGKTEQISLNSALVAMNMSWKRTTPLEGRCSVTEGWEGEGENGLRVTVFPLRYIYRSPHCDRKKWSGYYIVHPHGEHASMSSKKNAIKRMNAWFLDEMMFSL